MYESPIKTILQTMQEKLEADVLEIIQRHNVIVDKDELTKALKYDRDSYQKGYKDGIKEFAERLREKSYPFPCAIGVEYAVTIRTINDTLKETESENK